MQNSALIQWRCCPLQKLTRELLRLGQTSQNEE